MWLRGIANVPPAGPEPAVQAMQLYPAHRFLSRRYTTRPRYKPLVPCVGESAPPISMRTSARRGRTIRRRVRLFAGQGRGRQPHQRGYSHRGLLACLSDRRESQVKKVIVDHEGNVRCPFCGAANLFTETHFPSGLRCVGCGAYLSRNAPDVPSPADLFRSFRAWRKQRKAG
jgi:transcription elongation factor Elf1